MMTAFASVTSSNGPTIGGPGHVAAAGVFGDHHFVLGVAPKVCRVWRQGHRTPGRCMFRRGQAHPTLGAHAPCSRTAHTATRLVFRGHEQLAGFDVHRDRRGVPGGHVHGGGRRHHEPTREHRRRRDRSERLVLDLDAVQAAGTFHERDARLARGDAPRRCDGTTQVSTKRAFAEVILSRRWCSRTAVPGPVGTSA